MKQPSLPRAYAALLLTLCLLSMPLVALAKKGEKNFDRGIQYEKMEQWERAAQEYALAVAANPSDMEYQLHYRRALFNASQKFMEQGRTLAEQGDYAGAYNAFRQAYGYDPVNELALAEMNRMLRLQREKEGADGNVQRPPGALKNGTAIPSAFDATNNFSRSTAPRPAGADGQQQLSGPTPRSEQLRVINYNGDLEDLIRQLAGELGLNVIFDRDFPKRQIKLNLRDVTAARALDHIFFSQFLFFQKLDRRTILVAEQTKRGQYQQLVLRTFYLSNIDPTEARQLISSALPPNAGRQPQVTPNKTTNSITVRDTPENIRLIEDLLRSVDKDRAEVVMDVNIYEISRTYLMQLGNQIGDVTSLGNVGGFNPLTILVGGPNGRGQTVISGGTKSGGTKTLADATTAASTVITALGGSFVLPATRLSVFESRDNTKLLAHTQVHAFDGEQSTTRIGQKVPVQTAQVTPYGSFTGTGTTPGAAGGAGSIFGGGGYPVIQYQDTGLVLKFTPQVFPNQDVEVKMEIESNDVIGGPTSLTPTFSQRAVSGKARIPNNRTMMIASVAQDKQSRGRQGLPLLGLIPVLGRLFTTPTHNDSNADIVITVTPRVLSAPVITPEDVDLHASGTQQFPINDSLEAMVRDAEREEQLAAARQLPTNTAVRLPTEATAVVVQQTSQAAQTPAPQATQTTAAATQPQPPASRAQATDAETPTFVPAPQILASAPGGSAQLASSFAPSAARPVVEMKSAQPLPLVPVFSTDDPPPPARTVANANTSAAKPAPPVTTDAPPQTAAAPTSPVLSRTALSPAPLLAPGAELYLIVGQTEMRVGERQRVMLFVKTDAPLGLAAATIKFDPRLFAVRSVSKGSLFADAPSAQPSITQSLDPRGSVLALVAPPAGAPVAGMGVLLFVEVEALAAGESALGFDGAGVHLMAADGRSVAARSSQVRLVVK